MNRSIRALAVYIVALIISLGSEIESRSQAAEPGKSANKTSHPVESKKRRIPKLVIDQADRVILLKSLADCQRDAETIADPQQRFSALINMACGQLLAGDAGAAHATVAKANAAIAELPGDLTRGLAFTSMATQLGEYGDMPEAKKAVASAVELMKTLDPVNRVNVARGISRAQAMIGEEVGAKSALESAIEALTKMTTENQWRRSLLITVQGLIEAHENLRAQDIADAIPTERLELKVRVMGIAVEDLSQLPPDSLRQVIKRANETIDSIHPENPSAEILKAELISSMAASQAESGDSASAIATAAKIAQDVKDAKTRSLTRLTALIAIASAQVKAGELEKARTTFAEAIRIVQAVGEEGAQLKPESFRKIASAQAKAGMISEALKTADLIEGNDLARSRTLSDIGNAQVSKKENAAAAESFRRAFELAKKIEPKPDDTGVLIQQQQAFYEATCGLAGARSFDEAMDAAQYAITRDPERRTYQSLYALSQIAGERAWAGDIDGALKAASEIEDEWNRYNAYERVAKLEGEAGCEAHACEWIGKFDDPQIRLRLMWSVVRGLAKHATNPHEDLPDLSKWKKVGAAK